MQFPGNGAFKYWGDASKSMLLPSWRELCCNLDGLKCTHDYNEWNDNLKKGEDTYWAQLKRKIMSCVYKLWLYSDTRMKHAENSSLKAALCQTRPKLRLWHSLQYNFPFLQGNTVRTAQIHSKEAFKMCYLPHHQPSHNEGVEDGEKAINRCWVKTGQKEKTVNTDNKIFNHLEHCLKLQCNVKYWGRTTHTNISSKPNNNQDHKQKFHKHTNM